MEEYTVDLFDYISVIWKRKILIIVVTLVCIGIGVGVAVMNSRPKPPPVISYQADMIVKIGKRVTLVPSSGDFSSSVVVYIENPNNMTITIPVLYSRIDKGASGYHLKVEQVGALAMLKLTLSGPDEGVERGLKELADTLIDEHHRKAEDSVVAYRSFMVGLEEDAEMLRKNITTINTSINEMKKREEKYLLDVDRPEGNIEEGVVAADRSAYLNMLYLKSIDKEKDLSRTWQDLREIKRQLIMHRITLGNLEEYKTEVVSEIKSTAMEPEKKKKKKKKVNTILVAGVAGLIMSLFIAFFIEYIEESKSRRKGKLQG